MVTTLDQAMQMVEQLSAAEQYALLEHLKARLPAPAAKPVTRELLIAEHEALVAAGAFEHVESLRNKYADPDLELSVEELDASLHEIATAWEKELDELNGAG